MLTNNNAFTADLNIKTLALTAVLPEGFDVYVHLNPDLYQRWINGGEQVEGGKQTDEKGTFWVADFATFRLMNIEMKAGERQKISLKAIPNDTYFMLKVKPNYSFAIAHEAYDVTTIINESSPCIFTVIDNENDENGKITQANSGIELYPNPANETINLNFTAKSESIINIELYDIASRKVATLHNENAPQAGNKTITLTLPRGAKSGLYFIKIHYDGKEEIKKLAIVK